MDGTTRTGTMHASYLGHSDSAIWFGSGKSFLFLDIEQNIWTNLRDGVDAQR